MMVVVVMIMIIRMIVGMDVQPFERIRLMARADAMPRVSLGQRIRCRSECLLKIRDGFRLRRTIIVMAWSGVLLSVRRGVH